MFELCEILCPPRVSLGAEFEYFDFGVGMILLKIFLSHSPVEAAFAIRKKFPQFLHWKNKNDDLVFNVCSDCKIWFALECATGHDRFLNILSTNAYGGCFSSRISTPAFY